MRPNLSKSKLPAKRPAEQVVKDIRRATRRHFSAEDKIRIVLGGLRGDDSIAELCRKEGIAQSLSQHRKPSKNSDGRRIPMMKPSSPQQKALSQKESCVCRVH